jgi:hypothetical protein
MLMLEMMMVEEALCRRGRAESEGIELGEGARARGVVHVGLLREGDEDGWARSVEKSGGRGVVAVGGRAEEKRVRRRELRLSSRSHDGREKDGSRGERREEKGRGYKGKD